MLGSKIGKLFKRMFSRKYSGGRDTTTYKYTPSTWDGSSMSRYSNSGRLSAKELKWMRIYNTTGSDIRKRGIWRIAQKQLRHLFNIEQLTEHTEFNKSLSTTYRNEVREVIAREWNKLLYSHCSENRVNYPSDNSRATSDNSEDVLPVSPTPTITTSLLPLNTDSSNDTLPSIKIDSVLTTDHLTDVINDVLGIDTSLESLLPETRMSLPSTNILTKRS